MSYRRPITSVSFHGISNLLPLLGLHSNAACVRGVPYAPRNTLCWSLPSAPIRAIEQKQQRLPGFRNLISLTLGQWQIHMTVGAFYHYFILRIASS